jgi:hypothetical protein
VGKVPSIWVAYSKACDDTRALRFVPASASLPESPSPNGRRDPMAQDNGQQNRGHAELAVWLGLFFGVPLVAMGIGTLLGGVGWSLASGLLFPGVMMLGWGFNGAYRLWRYRQDDKAQIQRR